MRAVLGTVDLNYFTSRMRKVTRPVQMGEETTRDVEVIEFSEQ